MRLPTTRLALWKCVTKSTNHAKSPSRYTFHGTHPANRPNRMPCKCRYSSRTCHQRKRAERIERLTGCAPGWHSANLQSNAFLFLQVNKDNPFRLQSKFRLKRRMYFTDAFDCSEQESFLIEDEQTFFNQQQRILLCCNILSSVTVDLTQGEKHGKKVGKQLVHLYGLAISSVATHQCWRSTRDERCERGRT